MASTTQAPTASHAVRRAVGSLVTAGLLLTTGVGTAAAAPQAAMTGDLTWGPCATVTFTFDFTDAPSGLSTNDLRADATFAAAAVNEAAGRTLVQVAGATTTNGRAFDDGLNTISWGSANGGGYAVTSTGTVAGIARLVDGDIVLDKGTWGRFSADTRRQTLAHEIGHVLGLDHVVDAHEIMSYGFIDDGDGLGAGTSAALRTLYPGTNCDASPTIADADAFRVEGYRPTARTVNVASRTSDVRAAAVEAAKQVAFRSGTTNWATHAVICRADLFADCLGGAALAGSTAPILYVPGGRDGRIAENDMVLTFLASALPTTGTVYVLGGPGAVSDEVFARFAAVWPATRRVSGPDRYATAAAVAAEVAVRHGASSTALLARSDNPVDAVSAGAWAAANGVPVLLTDTTELPDTTAAALKALGTDEVVVLGGTGAIKATVQDAVEGLGVATTRVSGSTRTGTAVAVADQLWQKESLADGDALIGINGFHPQMWNLALASAPLAALLDAPVLLTAHDDVPWGAPTARQPAGDTGHWLANLGGKGHVSTIFVGAGAWADRHAAASFTSAVELR